MAVASGKCGSRHWNRAGSKLFHAITIARAAPLACVKNNRQGLPATPEETGRGLSGLSRSPCDWTAEPCAKLWRPDPARWLPRLNVRCPRWFAAIGLAKQDGISSAPERERRSWTMSTPRPHTANKPKPMTANGPITAAQAATSKRLAQAAYELDAFKSNPHPRRGGYAHRDANG
jgi:hypothetical protein